MFLLAGLWQRQAPAGALVSDCATDGRYRSRRGAHQFHAVVWHRCNAGYSCAGDASAQEVIETRPAVLAGRGDLQHSQARVTGATITVLKALGAGVQHDTLAAAAVSMNKRDVQNFP